MYFANCTTQEEAKRLYHDLARQYHPDLGGDLETMKAINTEYASFQAHGANVNARERQRAAHAEGKKSAADFHDIDEVTEILRVKIETALNLGLDVELCGLWVWVTGDTKTHKEELKEAKFKWSPKKLAWFFAGVPSFNRSEWSLDDIRNTYGSQKFKKEERQNARALTA